MIEDPNLSIMAAVVVGGVCAWAAFHAHQHRDRALHHVAGLHVANARAARFYDRYAVLLDDPATPPALLELLAAESIVMADREEARRFVQSFSKRPGTPDDEISLLLENLKKSRPDLVQAFQDAIMSGVLSMVADVCEGDLTKISQVLDFGPAGVAKRLPKRPRSDGVNGAEAPTSGLAHA